ncbi:MAG TPA: Hsp70 family protein [Polyangia bacterium]|jgi:Molecular chaperone|nr:Hsp70 family protein [Polyangia bacterium]
MAVVGIDLGTTNSVVATVRAGQVVVVPTSQGGYLHPSVVSFSADGLRYFSVDAVARRILDPKNTVYSAKRLIGLPFRSDEVQRALARLPYELREGNNEQAVFIGPDRTYTIPEVSGLLLGYLRQCAEMFLSDSVSAAVITVPATFNDSQRRATVDAGRIAGVDVLRVLNEPTAAALAYGLGQNMSQRIAVFDFGGGTFDITILRVENDVFEVLGTGGDTFLGGDDMDSALLNILAELFNAEHGVDPRSDQAARSRLLIAAEQVKRHLSDFHEARGDLKNIAVGSSGEPLALRFHIARSVFETAVRGLVGRTIQACQDVLGSAQLLPSQIDEVIMVGGTTRVPLVRAEVEKYFGRPPRTDLNPDEVVAWGAAIQAENLANAGESLPSRAVLLDVTPRALGIAVTGGFAERIVDRNAPVPVEQTRIFSTSADNQTTVRIQVCQGESRRFEENVPLGELELTNLQPARRGEVSIEVTFKVDTNGILRVRARDGATGAAREAAVNVRGAMSESEVEEAAERQKYEEPSNLPEVPEE